MTSFNLSYHLISFCRVVVITFASQSEGPGSKPGGKRVSLRSLHLDFPGGSEVKASACNVGDPGLTPGSGRSPGEGNGNPLQYSCLGNPMDRGDWWATVYAVRKSWTGQRDFTFTT